MKTTSTILRVLLVMVFVLYILGTVMLSSQVVVVSTTTKQQEAKTTTTTTTTKETSSTSASHNNNKKYLIPPILHFIHVSYDLEFSDNEMPAIVLDNIKEWQQLHPQYRIYKWTNAEIRAAKLPLLSLLFKIKGPRAWISDLLRYALLYEYGGVYLDTDVVPLSQSLDPLLTSLHDFTVCEKANGTMSTMSTSTKDDDDDDDETSLVHDNVLNNLFSWKQCELACNAVIGTRRHNPALQATLQQAIQNTEEQLATRKNKMGTTYRIEYTGPTVWTQVASSSSYNVTVLPTVTFYPCSWENTSACVADNFRNTTSYAMHQWSMTWVAAEERNLYHPAA